jgi:hypothetical protein
MTSKQVTKQALTYKYTLDMYLTTEVHTVPARGGTYKLPNHLTTVKGSIRTHCTWSELTEIELMWYVWAFANIRL